MKQKSAAILALCASTFLGSCTSDKDRQEASKKLEEANRLYYERNAQEALRACEEALKLDSGNPGARVLMGKIYFYDRNFEKAAKIFDEAYSKDSSNLNALYWMAKVEAMNPEKRDDALRKLDYVIARSSDSSNALLLKAEIHSAKKDLVNMMGSYSALIADEKRIAEAYDRLALHYKNANLIPMANAAHNRADLLRQPIQSESKK